MTEQATPNEIQEQINAGEQQEPAPTGTDAVAPPEAPAAASTSTSTSAPPPRQSSRIQQQSNNNNTNNSNNNNSSNASTSNNHDNQANQVTIDQIVHHTFQAGDDMGALNDLANEFDKIARNKDRQGNHSPFNQLMNDRSDPLARLIPGQHTLTLLYILSDRIFQVKTDQEINYLLPFIAGFANACDSYQLSLAPNRIHYLADRVAVLTPGNPQVVFEPLYNLITTYTASMPDNLTSLHSILAYHMLWTGNYQLALGFIDKTFIDCDKNASPIHHNHVLEYYYAAGMLNIKLGRLEEAEDSLEMCVTSPCQAATAIQIEAYKKLVLVQLLRKGKTSDLPKYVSTHVNRAIKNKAQIYTKLAQAYEHSEKTTKEVQELAQKDEPDYRNDHNVGLVIECLNLHVQRRIQRLARVYSCLSLNELSNLIGDDRSLNELAETLEQMTQKGWIICQIDASSPSGSPTVNFLNNEEKFNDVKSIEKIARLIKEGNEYNAIAVHRERKMSRSAAFLTKQGQPSRGGDSRFGGFMGGDDLDDFDDELLS